MLYRRTSVLLSATTLSTVLWGPAVVTSILIPSPVFAAALLAAPMPSPASAELPQVVLEELDGVIVDSNVRIASASASQGYLGVTVRDVDPNRAEKEKLNGASGAEVVSLDHDAPAAKAGLHTGDIIQSINGQIVGDSAALTRLLREMPVGKLVDLQIVHNAKIELLHLQLGDRSALIQHAWAHHFHVLIPEPAPMVNGFAGQHSYTGNSAAADSETPDPQAYVGALVEPLTPQLAKFFGVRAGNGLLVRSVEDKSPAASAGLDAGDIIVTANGMPLETAADWIQTLRINAGRPVTILVLRNRKLLTMAITVDSRITQSELAIPEQLRELRESLNRYAL